MRCKICAEVWGLDDLHEEVAERFPYKPWYIDGKYNQAEYDIYMKIVKDDFFNRGCVAIGGSKEYCIPTDKDTQSLIAFVNDLEGHDSDGLVNAFEDIEDLGWI